MMPAVFVSHGSPMTAVERGPYQDALRDFGARLRPAAILAVSAHWETAQPLRVTTAARHQLVYDFGGFPGELYQVQYPAPGSPELARRVAAMVGAVEDGRGLDHGVWTPLVHMFPRADVPVVSLSLGVPRTPAELYRIGNTLAALRNDGVLILASGGIVHNLRKLDWRARDAAVAPWAAAFDAWVAERASTRRAGELLDYRRLAPHAEAAVPTTEHFDPLFVALGAASHAPLQTVYEGFEYGTLSMRTMATAQPDEAQ